MTRFGVVNRAQSAQGDAQVAKVLNDLARHLVGRVAAAVIDCDRTPVCRCAFIRASAESRFEIGSITKGLSGMLLADAIDRGEIALETTVGDVVPSFANRAVGSVTIRELCTHTSGLPRLVRRSFAAIRGLRYGVLQMNPYRGISTSDVLELAARQRLVERGQRRYSNLGGALLGHLLAARVGIEYGQLLKERVLVPTGMDSTDIAIPGHTAPWGRSASKLPRQPWVMGGFSPAGGVVSTTEDMARLAHKLLDGAAPGCSSLIPIEGVATDRPNRHSGMFWIVDVNPRTGRPVIWHNGGTGGYSALLSLVPDLRRAAVVLVNAGGQSAKLEPVVRTLMATL
jgi:CubicO group peptidase (beta-lactamase class C family)